MRKRNNQVMFRLNKSELEMLNKKVKKSGLSKETFIRQTLENATLHEKPDEEFYDIMRELSSIGNRINQIAVKANALGFIDTPMLESESKKWSSFRLKIREKFLDSSDD